MKLLALAVLVVSLAVPALAASAAQSSPTLNGVVGPGFAIKLTEGGQKVTKLTAGTYTIKVSDKSALHDFHLVGPGVNKKTPVAAKTSTTWTVTLKKGTYKYDCDPHAAFMKGSFTVS